MARYKQVVNKHLVKASMHYLERLSSKRSLLFMITVVCDWALLPDLQHKNLPLEGLKFPLDGDDSPGLWEFSCCLKMYKSIEKLRLVPAPGLGFMLGYSGTMRNRIQVTAFWLWPRLGLWK